MGQEYWGWNPWRLGGEVGTRGWNPWGFDALSTPTASMVRTLSKGQKAVQPAGVLKSYEAPTFDSAGAYRTWAFDVRMSLLVVEFLGQVSLAFDINGNEAAVIGVVDDKPTSIFTLKAPTDDAINNGAKGLRSTQDSHPADSDEIDALVAQNEGIDAFMLRCAGAAPEVHGAKYELAHAASILVNLVCLRMKHAFAVKRPSELDSGIVPLLPVPGHGSFPGGHATMASALVHVIHATVKGTDHARLKALAAQIAANRVKAGLHYELDSDAGRDLGDALGRYLVDTLVADAKKLAGEKRLLPLLGVVWARASEQ